MALQLTGAFKTRGAREPARRAAGRRHRRRPDRHRHGDGAARLLPDPVREDARAVRDARGREGREGRPHPVRRRGARAARPASRARRRGAPRAGARARRAARSPTSRASAASGAASRSSTARAMEESPAYRLNHEEVVKALEEGISFIEDARPGRGRPRRATASSPPMRFQRKQRRDRGAARALLPRRGGHDAEHHLREGVSRHVPDGREAAVLPPAPRRAIGATAILTLTPAPGRRRRRLLHRLQRATGKLVTFFGDNHPAFNGNVVKAMASAKKGYPAIVSAVFPIRRRRARSGREPEWNGLSRRSSTTLSSRASSRSTASRRRSSRSSCGPRPRPPTSSPASSSGCRTSRPARRRSAARRS